MREKVACIAGTPVDTDMGAELLEKNGYEAFPYPTAENPVEQMRFQVSSAESKFNTLLNILNKIKVLGIKKVLVYCNSLSSAVDFNKLSSETGLKIVTPLNVYEMDAKNYKSIAIIAANAVATKKIEEIYLKANKDIGIISIGMLPLVISIEKKISPDEIIKIHNLEKVCEWFLSNGAEALLLGCTHFPYIYEELRKVSSIPIVDPSKKMIELLMKSDQ